MKQNMQFSCIFAFLLCISVQNGFAATAAQSEGTLQTLIAQLLTNSPAKTDKVLQNTYQLNGNTPYWVNESGPGQKAHALISVLSSADEDGLDPLHYRLESIEKLWSSRAKEDLATLDLSLTLALGAYVTDMREGRSIKCLLDPKLFAAARDKETDISQIIVQALQAPDLVNYLQQQAPQHHGYQSLKKALSWYRKLAAQGGWKKIPAGKTIKPEMTDERLPLITRRLVLTHDLPAGSAAGNQYKEALVDGVKHFQARYNLDQDGVIGKLTLLP